MQSDKPQTTPADAYFDMVAKQLKLAAKHLPKTSEWHPEKRLGNKFMFDYHTRLAKDMLEQADRIMDRHHANA
jgi:hypothetical protein